MGRPESLGPLPSDRGLVPSLQQHLPGKGAGMGGAGWEATTARNSRYEGRVAMVGCGWYFIYQ